MKFLILPILAGAFALSLNAQERTIKDNTLDCGSIKDSVLLQLNRRKDVITVKRNAEQFSVSRSNSARYRKTYDCPDIFAAAPKRETPAIITAPPVLDPPPTTEAPVKGKPFFLPDPVFFRINKSVIDASEWSKIELAVEYLVNNPGSTVVVTGYADKKTGNMKINLRLSEQRSNAVAKALREKYNISKNRISVNWKGDGLQPFEFDNDKNRAVLFLINP